MQPTDVDRERTDPAAEGSERRPMVTDGGSTDDPDDEETTDDESNVDVTPAGEAEPAEPKWEPPDLDDLPDFEVRAEEPVVRESSGTETGAEDPISPSHGTNPQATADDPTAGMPHDAQAPGATAMSGGGTEAYVAALELCARLPDDVRLPEEAPDLVPAAVEAELERDIQQFAAAEFDSARPHVDALDFKEIDGEVWLRIRIGVPTAGFESLDTEAIREHALQQLEGVF